MKTKGLREQIASAGTTAEVRALVGAGIASFKQASDKTKRRWIRTADRRIKQMAK